MRRENVAKIKELFAKKHIPEDFDRAMPYLRCKLVGYEANNKYQLMEANILHTEVLTLALVPFYDLGEDIFLLPVEVTQIWGKTQAEIVRASLAATWKAYPPRITALGGDLYALHAWDREANTAWKPYGAVAIVMPEILSQTAEILHADFYLILSTSDEALVFPIREGETTNPDNLRRILSQLHASQAKELPSDLIMPDTIYIYRRGIGLTIA